MKKRLLFSCLLVFFASRALAQVTYLADTAFTTDAGYGGAAASCVYTGGHVTGWLMDRNLGLWVADAFTVPAGSSWIFDTVIVYGIQRYSGTTSTFTSCNLQIYSGIPGIDGAVIWGDTTTNVLVSTGFSGIYRVDTTVGLTDTIRPIMYLKLYLLHPPKLGAGTYWLSWSATASLSLSPGTPPKVLPGRINPPEQQGRLFFDGGWNYLTDNSRDVGLDMIIKASAATVATLGAPKVVNEPQPILSQNVPNPVTGSTVITFYIPRSGYEKLCVYNAMGQLVTTLVDGFADAGQHSCTFNANGLPPGMYYYQLWSESGIITKEMVVGK